MNLKRFCDSGLHKKIILFFIENPASVDSPRGIATWVGYGRGETRKALDELVGSGILNSMPSASTAGYSLTKNGKIIKQVKEFLQQEGERH